TKDDEEEKKNRRPKSKDQKNVVYLNCSCAKRPAPTIPRSWSNLEMTSLTALAGVGKLRFKIVRRKGSNISFPARESPPASTIHSGFRRFTVEASVIPRSSPACCHKLRANRSPCQAAS